MTGRDLLVALQGRSDEELAYLIYTEGCDCWGTPGALVVEKSGKKDVLLLTLKD